MTVDIITTKINKIDLISLNNNKISLKNIFVTLNIYESLFENFKLGKLIIKDTFDLISTFPILGGEELEIFFSSDNDSQDQKSKIQSFVIYNIESDNNIQQQEDNKKLITLYFCSPEMIEDKKNAVSRRFSDDTEIVLKYIVNDILKSTKDFNMHKVDNKLDFISNFWSPSKILKYIETNSRNVFDDYIFYENMLGFNFNSISNLMQQDVSHTIHFSDDLEMLYSYNSVKGKLMKKYFNDIEALKFGVYGNTYFKIDPSYYGFNKFQQDFTTITDHNTSLGKNVQHRDGLINNNSINLTYNNGNQLSKRDLILKSLSKYHQIIKMNGDSTKTIGQVIDFEINLRVREKLEINDLLTGKWFITNINHELNHDGTYEQIIKITKNAFFNFKDFEKIKGRKNLWYI